MRSDEESDVSAISSTFEAQLNHGLAFQHRIALSVHEAFNRSTIRWHFVASEFPVEVRNKNTHIDIILRADAPCGTATAFIALECKRANPALSAWCFTNSAHERFNRAAGDERFFCERVRIDPSSGVAATGVQAHIQADFYQIGLAVKRKSEKGDSNGGNDRKAIQEAVDQALLGANGLVEHCARPPHIMGNGSPATVYVIPVVVTTAKIYAGASDYKSVDVTTGHHEKNSIRLSKRPLVFYQAHMSTNLAHSCTVRTNPDPAHNDDFLKPLALPPAPMEAQLALERHLDLEFIRTVPIVSAEHVVKFLESFDPWLEFSRIDK